MIQSFSPYWVAILLSAGSLAKAQTDRIGFFIDNEAETQIIPLEVVNNLPVITLYLGGLFPIKLIFDTGARHTILFQEELLSLFPAMVKRPIKIRGLGPGEALDALSIAGATLTYQDLKGINISLVVLQGYDAGLYAQTGMEIHGIIGNDLLKMLSGELNYAKATLTLRHQTHLPGNDKKWEKLPLLMAEEKPYILAEIILNKKSTEIPLLIDSGSSIGLTLFPFHYEQEALPENKIKTYVGNGLSGKMSGYIGRTEKLEIGNLKYKQVITIFPDSVSTALLTLPQDRHGSIGGEVLRRMRVIFDYTNQCVYVKKNTGYDAKFTFIRTGFYFSAEREEGKNIFIISDVIPDTPAAQLLKPMDELLKVGKRKTRTMSYDDLMTHLSKTRSGKSLSLVIRREGREISISLPMKDLL